jgi:hypothetical protein
MLSFSQNALIQRRKKYSKTKHKVESANVNNLADFNRQNKFIDAVVSGKSMRQAAIEAGYEPATITVKSHQMMKNPFLRKKVEDAVKKAQEHLELTFEWKLRQLKELVERALPEHNREFSTAAISAIAEMNKMQGHYAPDKTVSATMTVDADFTILSELMDKLLLTYEKDY